jgi:transcriptional regulator with XRE-family HTH domain
MQQTTKILGQELRKLRKARKQSLIDASTAIGVERSYLNNIELGKIRPSRPLLDKILVHFSVEGNNAVELKELAGYNLVNISLVNDRKEEESMAEKQLTVPQPGTQVNINPLQTPVLYTDSIFVNSTDNGLVLDVAQTVGGQQHNVVSRIGMSFDHAKKLLVALQDHIEKNER